jgi:hypothetical protein
MIETIDHLIGEKPNVAENTKRLLEFSIHCPVLRASCEKIK